MPLTLSPPACRLLYVTAFTLCRENGASGPAHEVTPVLSLLATDSDDGTLLQAVVFDSDFGLITTDELEQYHDLVGTLVPAPWPPEEDEARLEPTIRRLRALAGKRQWNKKSSLVAASTA